MVDPRPRCSSASASSPSASTTLTTAACRRSSWRRKPRRAALADAGVGAATVAAAIDTVFGLRQFEISGPMPATLGKSNNYPRSVMNRLGGDPARVVLEPVGGQATEAGHRGRNAIVAGDADVVMIMGSEPGRPRSTSPTGTTSPTSPSTSTAARGPRPPDLQLHRRVHDSARAHRCSRAVRAARERAPRAPRPERRRLPPADGRALRRLSRKWLPRTRSRRLRWSDRSTRSSPSPTTTG